MLNFMNKLYNLFLYLYGNECIVKPKLTGPNTVMTKHREDGVKFWENPTHKMNLYVVKYQYPVFRNVITILIIWLITQVNKIIRLIFIYIRKGEVYMYIYHWIFIFFVIYFRRVLADQSGNYWIDFLKISLVKDFLKPIKK